MSNLQLLDRAATAATCGILQSVGSTLVGVGTVGAVSGGPALVPLGAGALSLLASNYLCPDMEMGGTTPNPSLDGCQQVDGVGQIQVEFQGNWIVAFPQGNTDYDAGRRAVEITDVYVAQAGGGQWMSVISWRLDTGQITTNYQYKVPTEEEAKALKWRIDPLGDSSCVRDTDDPPPIPPDAFEPIQYTDNITNCNYTVTLQGFAQPVPDGPVNPVFLIEEAQQTRNDGGRMGGCNFPPTIYMPDGGGSGGGNGGGGTYLPVPDGGPPPVGPDGLPWWAAPLLAGTTAAALTLLGQQLEKLFAPSVNAGSFTLVAPCDKDEQGNPLTATWNFPQQKLQQRLLTHQVALMEILQQHLNWKTPTCREHRPEKRGTWISTHWCSDGNSPNGTKPLRKLFRYRSESTRTNDELQTYWSDFEWTSGSVCVIHKGAWWGTPQVWASSAEEGKRVIRRAGTEAGLDPDKTGEWLISSSDSSRYGVSGKMRLAEEQGERWVTRREGASGLPEL